MYVRLYIYIYNDLLNALYLYIQYIHTKSMFIYCFIQKYKQPAAKKSPLHGIRILDLSRVLAGPYCTMLLGELGAEVIKIERPELGDDTRQWGPPYSATESAYFLCANRNKKSITVDLKHPQGIDLIKQLASKSDVIFENFLPGKMKELGLDYSTVLSKLNPRLIYCSLTGFGSTGGPYAHKAGYDLVAQAVGGLMHITGEPGGRPLKLGVAISDLTTGLFAHSAILAALFARETTGKGQQIDCSLLDSTVALLANVGSNYLIANQEAQRRGNSHPSIVPYEDFPTQDGFIVVAVGNDRQFSSLCQVFQRSEIAQDPKFSKNADRVKNRAELIPLLETLFKTQPTAYWVAKLDEHQIPCGPINSLHQVFSDPQVQHRKLVQEIEHPTCGPIKVVGYPVKFSDSVTKIQSPPPTLGQHTEQVLKEVLGKTDAEVAILQQQKIV